MCKAFSFPCHLLPFIFSRFMEKKRYKLKAPAIKRSKDQIALFQLHIKLLNAN